MSCGNGTLMLGNIVTDLRISRRRGRRDYHGCNDSLNAFKFILVFLTLPMNV